MEYDIRIEKIDSCPLAVVRRRVNLREIPKVVVECCGIVWDVVRARQIAGAGRHVAMYLDDQINLEVGVELKAPFAGHGEVVGSALPAGRAATTTHLGPYNRLTEAHQAIRGWCDRQGHSRARPCWEIYGHWMDAWNADPSQVLTDIYYLLTS